MESLNEKKSVQREPEHKGPIWTHPYFIYAMINAILLIGLLVAAWLAWTYEWIPVR